MVSQTDVVRYAAKNPSITKLLANGKLQFTQTGQEFPPNTPKAVLEAYISGRAYRRALTARANEGYDFAQHKPHIVPHRHRDENHFLYCTLTGATLPKRKDVVEGHVKGKRFLHQIKELEQAKERRERKEKKRKEKRERAKKRREQKANGVAAEDNAEENEEPDVLEGLISDSEGEEEEEGPDDQAEKGDEDMEDANADQEKEDEVEKLDAMDDGEEEGEAGSVFWTRGRSRGVYVEDDDDVDDDDEWATAPRKASAPAAGVAKKASHRKEKKSERKPKKKAAKSPSPVVEMDEGKDAKPVESGNDNGGSATKRSRSDKKVGKKARRPRQRRKTAPQAVET